MVRFAQMPISGFTSLNSQGGSFLRAREGPGPLSFSQRSVVSSKKVYILSLPPWIPTPTPLSFCSSSATANSTKCEGANERNVRDLGEGSEVVYMPRFLTCEKSWEYFRYLDQHMPWTRPTIHVLGKPFLQPRDVCYVASKGLKELIYSGHTPYAHSWDDYPPLKEILEEVHKAFPGSHFNSLLINRYNSGNDYVGWHADVHKELYGPTPEIASISFGCERDFFLKRKYQGEGVGEKHCFNLKHGSLLLMRGNTQRDWLHSVPKRAKAKSARINLTFRRVMQMLS